MSEHTITVTLTLRRSTAERLRTICHARGETASLVVDRWVLLVDGRGEMSAKREPCGAGLRLPRPAEETMTDDKPDLSDFVFFVINVLLTVAVVVSGAEWWVVALCVCFDLTLLPKAARGLFSVGR